jgi:hypothetical protein
MLQTFSRKDDRLMCIIAICEDKRLDYAEFMRYFKSNPDGVGFVYTRVGNGKLMYMKGMMDKDEAWSKYINNVGNSGKHIVHFRKSSIGDPSPELTHPFFITNHISSVMPLEGEITEPIIFHNGHFMDWQGVFTMLCVKFGEVPAGEISDTRVLAMALSFIKPENWDKYLEVMEGNKFAVVHPDGNIERYGMFKSFGKIHLSSLPSKR